MRMKKFISLILAGSMVLMLAACGNSEKETSSSSTAAEESTTQAAASEEERPEASTGVGVAKEDLRLGFVFIGDENDGYTEAFYKGVLEMQETLGLSDEQIVIKWNIPETEACYDAAVDLAEQSCNAVFANSFGHEDYFIQAAEEYPEVEFCHATGVQAASSGLSNMHNYYTSVHESRYVSGVAAGLKLNEMIENGEIEEDAAKIGYVGAYPYAQVISGFTAYYLGVKSVCPSAVMDVKYDNSWGSFDLEKETAEALIADGCVIISQHANTTGAPTACEAAAVPVVGYNISMIETAPNTAITSASMNWGPYYTYAVECLINGEAIATDWCKGYEDGAARIMELNDTVIAEGTADKVAEIEDEFKNGALNVFDTSTWTVNGETLDTYEANGVEYISDGYFHESEYGSAPAFDIIIDGITVSE